MYSWFSDFAWNDGGIMLLPFMAIPSNITISSLNDHYVCRSFCTLALVGGQSCNTYSDSMLRFSSSVVTDLISSVVIQSGISMDDCRTFMDMFFPSISLSVLVLLSCLDRCDLDLHSIHMLYWWMHSNIPL